MARPLICLSNSHGMEVLMAKHPWSWLMAVPILLLTACTVGGEDEFGGGGSVDSVTVTVQGRYEKRDLGVPGTPLTTKATRYA